MKLKRRLRLFNLYLYWRIQKRMTMNELTCRDVQRIVQIAGNLCNSLDYYQVLRMGEEGYYTEILKRFNEQCV